MGHYDKNPFTFEEICKFIDEDLSQDYKDMYDIIDLPNITNVLKQVEVDFLQTQRDEAIKNYLNQIRSEYKIYINPDLQI